MKVVLISQGASRVAPAVLAQRDAKVVGIVESAPRRRPRLEGGRRDCVVRRLRQSLRRPRSLAQLARRHHLPYLLYHQANTPELVDWLRGLEVDLILVQSMSRLLPAEVLSIPPLGILNLHPSLLPAYRGPNPWFWVFRNDEHQTGVTLHYLDRGEDTGDVVYQEPIAIARGVRLPELLDHAIGEVGVGMIRRALRVLASGQELPRQVQPAASPTDRARNIDHDEYQGLISWADWSAERVWHFLRGTESFLSTLLPPNHLPRGVRATVGEFSEDSPAGPPGAFASDHRGPFLACCDGTVRIDQTFSLRRWLLG